MENASYIALSRQMVLRRQLDIIANNMANATTPAFKGEDMLFVEHLERTDSGPPLSFVDDLAVIRDTSEGPMTSTGNPLDFAIHGPGYFVVNTPQGPRYTRLGRFQLDANGTLVTSQGDAVLDTSGAPIFVPVDDGELVAASDGTLSTTGGPLTRIAVVRFADEQAMQRQAGGLYTAAAQPLPALDAKIVQGMVEDSNVQPVVELTRMVSVLRDYEAAQRLLESEHERQRRGISTIVSANS